MPFNPLMFTNGMPVPFVNEMFDFTRESVEFEINKIPRFCTAKAIDLRQHKRSIFLYQILHNLGLFPFCFSLQCTVDQVVPDGEYSSPHSFRILFKEGGCGTFVPLFFKLIGSVRQYSQHSIAQFAVSQEAPQVDPLQVTQTGDEMMQSAECRYVDPNDPTTIFLQQPVQESQLRRRTYQSQLVEHSM
ncbi:hypothetical protein MKX01_034951 [Papaver californicum]|nr:hypothetical protein MKX01_034951 [Papaver californicum]